MSSMENKKLRINMLSSSEKVAGQGVSGAYRELVSLLHRDAKDQLIVTENLPVEADVTHFHTIDFPYYLSTFQKKRSGRKVGYVHFLPETLEGSLKIPFFLKGIVKRYVLFDADGVKLEPSDVLTERQRNADDDKRILGELML